MSTAENAVRVLLAELGLTVEDLLHTTEPTPTPTQYLPRVIEASGAGALRTYQPYWNRAVAAFGERRLDQITATDLQTLIQQTVHERIRRRTDRGGTSTREHMLRALRAIYTRAVADNLIPPHRNRAARIPKPPRPHSTRRALSPDELAAINNTAATTGNDTTLDCLLIRLHTETAARRNAALALREQDLDPRWHLIRLAEKRDTIRWQPVSPSLMHALLGHRTARSTGGPTDQPLLRYRNGNPLTTRRYDHLWHRIGEHLPPETSAPTGGATPR